MDTQASFQTSHLQIQAIHNSVEKLKDVADRMTARALGCSSFHQFILQFLGIQFEINASIHELCY